MQTVTMPRLMISAPGSSSGKTTVTCGILKALMKKGMKVAAFKSGPDYIDPMFHSKVIGAKSRNLDVFMLGDETAKYLAAKNFKGCDIAVFEGAMGFYDGMGKTTESSAYNLACVCDTPVVLVVNAKGAALSVAATIKGFKEFRSDSRIVGAILNNVNPMTYLYYKYVIEKETGVKLIGYFPVMKNCNFESRHLGLVTAEEIGDLQRIVDELALQAEKSIDLDALIELATAANPIKYKEMKPQKIADVKIAVAYDKAFCFYYQDALDLLTELGAELIYFSPMKDKILPECDGMILGGGYPELYAKELSENTSMLESIKEALTNQIPCYAECGGFMYLLDRYIDGETDYAWVGVFNGETYMTSKLNRFGYVKLTAQQDNMFCKNGDSINAHEFHYSESTLNGNGFRAFKASGKGNWECCNVGANYYAGYPHLHLWGNRIFAENFVTACSKYSKSK